MDVLVIGKDTDGGAKISTRCKELMETNEVALIELLLKAPFKSSVNL
jgi:hypothetical protein